MNSSAQRALEILEIVSTSHDPVGVTSIAQRAGIPPGTAFRSLDALERRGYVTRFNSSTHYVPGETMRRLRQSVFARFHVRDVCIPYMHQLAFAGGETTALTVPVGWYAVTLAVTEGARDAGRAPAQGTIVPLGAGFASNAILASFPPGVLERYRRWHDAAGLPPVGTGDLATIRGAGYALGADPATRDGTSIAFPLRSADGVIGALAIFEPPEERSSAAAAARIAVWRDTVATIERRIAEHPALFRNPFDHIDPDTIDLPSVARTVE